MNRPSSSKTTSHRGASPRKTSDAGSGPSAAFYFFVGALALSLLTLLASLIFM